MALKIPNVIPKKPVIKGVDNKLLLGGGLATIAIVGFIAYKQGWIPGISPTKQKAGPANDTGGLINAQLNTNNVKAGTPVLMAGVAPSNTQLYYGIFGADGQLREQGILPPGQFTKNISTSGYKNGDYLVKISDIPFNGTTTAAVDSTGDGTGDSSILQPSEYVENNEIGDVGTGSQDNLVTTNLAIALA